MTTAVYVRVSTTEQSNGLESQKAAIRTYLRNHRITNAKWFTDKVSGAKVKRPALDRLREAIFNGEVNTVIVWALDRLTRRGPRDGLELLSRWMKKGVRVISITEQLDFGDDSGEMIASLLFSIAKMYRTKLIENTKRGLAEAKARGVRLGKRPTLFFNEASWKSAKSGVQRPKFIEPLLAKGMSVSEIARELNVSRQAVYNVLERASGRDQNLRIGCQTFERSEF